MEEISSLLISDNHLQITKSQKYQDIPRRQTSWFAGCLILANVAMGSGLLSYPKAYYLSGGVGPAITIQMVFITLSQIGMVMIAYCSDISSRGTYPEIMEFFTGKIGLYLTNLFVIMQDFGQCITYLIVIADQADQVMSYSYGIDFCHHWYLDRNFTLPVISFLLILPFCFLKDINSLRFVSALGIVSVINLIVLVIHQYFHTQNIAAITPPSSLGMGDILKALPIFIFSFQTHIEVAPIYSSFRKRKIGELAKSVVLQTILCLIVYNLMGSFGYYTFGDKINSDILTNYYPINTFIIVTMTVLALKTSTSYPTAFYCPRLVVISIINSFHRGAELPEKPKRIVVVCFMFSFSIALALLFPNIGCVFSLLGAICALLMYFLPGICFALAHVNDRENYSNLKFILGLCFAAVGAFVAGSIFTQSLTTFIYEKSSMSEVLCQ